MKADGTKTSSHAEAVEVLAEFFGSVYIKEDTTNIPKFSTRCSVQIVTEEDLLKNCQHLIPVKLWVQIKCTHGF